MYVCTVHGGRIQDGANHKSAMLYIPPNTNNKEIALTFFVLFDSESDFEQCFFRFHSFFIIMINIIIVVIRIGTDFVCFFAVGLRVSQ
jgi:hypothetical protein